MWREQILPGDDNATLCASVAAEYSSELGDTGVLQDCLA